MNFKGILTSQHGVEMLWVSFLFTLHVERIQVTTERSMLLECVSMSFLMFVHYVQKPHVLGTKPFENLNAIICGMQREFTVKYSLVIIGKIFRIWKGVIDGGLKFSRSTGGYASSIATPLEVNDTNNHSVTSSN